MLNPQQESQPIAESVSFSSDKKYDITQVYKFCTILKLTTRYCDTSTELPDKPKLIIQRKEEFSEIENSHLAEVL
ncbi:hypothetical protein IGI04_030453 [Brassica rapa subsp. trilocularis]|uniref:Uncharacterized protein n=1 Tax=Brassica rapa subsp. trilocularis TaxID=1813537 RepID=A0ABQ7LQT4_BRACM|nr:hypothetical protein IGI04_030453 [Brassica rapa subsp. trilocularis]